MEQSGSDSNPPNPPFDGDATDEGMSALGSPLDHPMDAPRAERFYDRVRSKIAHAIETKSGKVERFAEYLLFVPDVFILLWRLANDKRVSGKNKVLLGSGLAYYIFPLDVVPEALLGPIGYLDDLVFGVYILNKMLTDTDEAILREHWSGQGDLLETIRKVLGAADTLVTTDFVGQIKKMMK
jgi:uncharacterized membrane protein YkvA (DUF1232 family)